jgi:bifunctional non-homologous end joining protein LigD
MPLGEYKKMRRFSKTPEPEGAVEKRAKGKHRFVIQKHAATRLHYDFRLEIDGVLKSWAVPKGPSLRPADKRLAMMTEDHPMGYRTFEGTIPAGNYGAGEVIVWDEGTYEPHEKEKGKTNEQILRAMLNAGKVSFDLHGTKLNGHFELVKMHGKEDNAWLLFKKKDGDAEDRDVTEDISSARSSRTLEDRNKNGKKPASAKVAKKSPSAKAVAKGGDPMPFDAEPMLATLVEEAFDRDGWIFEMKWDGYRAVGGVRDGEVTLLSRTKQDFRAKFPPVVEALEELGHDAVIDGEVVAMDGKGKSNFQLLQNFVRTKKGNLEYRAFDLLWLDGHDVRSLPLLQRKELLKALIGKHPILKYSDHVEKKGAAFFREAEKAGLEGIMAKNADSPYASGKRTADWLKIKTHMRQEVVICGFTEPRSSRKHFGALVVGVYDGKKLRYAGHVGGGFNAKTLAETYAKMKPLARKSSPFDPVPKTNEPVTWLKPELVCEVSFQEWTQDGSMRQPIFKGMRIDKPATAVKPEMPQKADDKVEESEGKKVVTKKSSKKVAASSSRAQLTHLDKVFWQDAGVTKGDVIEYYRRLAPTLLPYLKDRPENMLRHPHGPGKQGFFQKDNDHAPEWVRIEDIASESKGEDIQYLVCDDLDTLLYMANLGCIEINPWNSRVGSLDRPDYLIMDIDPKDIGFDAVIDVAQSVRRTLAKAGVEGYPKTSGKRGLHIFVPLGAKYTHDQSRQFAEIVAAMVHKELPDITTVERSIAKRPKSTIYIDYLQNRLGQTLAAPYSVRPWKGPTVSTPLEWSEVKKGLDPMDFTIDTIFKRLEKKGDLWKPVLGHGIDLERALKRLSKA